MDIVLFYAMNDKFTLRKYLFLSGVILGIFFLASCGKTGRNFDSGLVSSIKVNETTQDEVHGFLGDPFKVGLDDGDSTWTYEYNKWYLFRPTISKDFTVRFDEFGVVTSYSYNTNYSPSKKKAHESEK